MQSSKDKMHALPRAAARFDLGNAVRTACLSAGAAALMFASAGSFAAASEDTTGEALEEVIVTGSHLARVDTETPSPVQIVSEQELKASGYTTVTEVLQNLTVNGQGTLSNGFSGAFAGGATGISLRGLNTSATLVMIDGHRMAPYPLSDDNQRSFVDISSIPFDTVERVEVLKDGASAVYGSDAIAGVVNIILKKSFVGTQVSAEAGTTTEGGGATEHATFMHGMGDLDSDGYNAYFNAEYRHQDDILLSQRQGRGLWSSLNQTSIGGNNQTPGVVTGLQPIPPTYGTVYLTPLTGAFSAANSYFYPAAIKPNSAYKGNCTYALLQSGGCAYINPEAQLQPAADNLNFLASFKHKLGEDWMLDVKGSLFDSRGSQYGGTVSSNGLFPFPTSKGGLVSYSADIPLHVVGPVIPAITVPANYPGNPFGAPAKVRGVNLDEAVRHTDFNSKSYRLVFDLTGKALGWDLDTSVGYTRVDTKQWNYSLINRAALNAALNRPVDPFLITGGNTAADLAAIFPVGEATDTSELEFGEINASRSVFDLPGGPLGVSAGAQIINRSLDAPAPLVVAEGLVNGGNLAFSQGSQADAAVYAEFAAPIVKMLEIDGHVRYDHFNNSGGDATPSIGFKFKPIEQFALRGTWGRGFRAPNPIENGRSGSTFSAGTTFDPILCPGGNKAAAGAVIQYCNFAPVYANAPNPNLKPEKSYSDTLGIVVEPFRAWSSTLDFFDVKISNQIVQGTANPNLSTGVRTAPVTDTCSDGAGGVVPCVQPVGAIVYVPVLFVNANSTEVRGLELTSKYNLSLGAWGSVTTEIDWSHLMSYLYGVGGVTYQLAGTHGPATIGGNTGNPKDRVQGSVAFDRGGLDVRATVNWISAFDLTDPSGSNGNGPITNCSLGVVNGGYLEAWFNSGQPNNPSYCKVAQFITTNLTASYRFEKHWTVHGAVDNVFNRQPPLDLNSYGGENVPYNPSMHQAGAVGRFVDLGFIFSF
jgi:iron complex outermembrane recepter protein